LSEQINFALGISIVSLTASIIAVYYARSRAQATRGSFLLSAFNKSLGELGTKEARKYRRYIHQNFPEYISEHYSSKEGKEVTLWVKSGDSRPQPKSVRVKHLEEEDIEAFEEIAVRADRIGFMFYSLEPSKKLEKKYFSWLCVMFCEIWNKLAPHIILRRKERSGGGEEEPQPVYFTPYFERLVYDVYEYYKKLIGENVRIFCLNPECSVELD